MGPTHAQLTQLLAALRADFDVVYPLTAFDHGLIAVAERLGLIGEGLPPDSRLRPYDGLRYARVSPRIDMFGGGPVGAARAAAIASACPNRTECEAQIGMRAPLDQLLYESMAKSRGKRLVREEPPLDCLLLTSYGLTYYFLP